MNADEFKMLLAQIPLQPSYTVVSLSGFDLSTLFAQTDQLMPHAVCGLPEDLEILLEGATKELLVEMYAQHCLRLPQLPEEQTLPAHVEGEDVQQKARFIAFKKAVFELGAGIYLEVNPCEFRLRYSSQHLQLGSIRAMNQEVAEMLDNLVLPESVIEYQKKGRDLYAAASTPFRFDTLSCAHKKPELLSHPDLIQAIADCIPFPPYVIKCILHDLDLSGIQSQITLAPVKVYEKTGLECSFRNKGELTNAEVARLYSKVYSSAQALPLCVINDDGISGMFDAQWRNHAEGIQIMVSSNGIRVYSPGQKPEYVERIEDIAKDNNIYFRFDNTSKPTVKPNIPNVDG